MTEFKKEMYYILAFFVALFIGWVLIGGPEQARQSGSAQDKFQKPLAPLDSGETYDRKIFN
jgi:hypothetical protein